MRSFVGANWKMNGSGVEGLAYLERLKDSDVESEPVDVVLFAPFTLLPVLAEDAREAGISLGAQDLYWQDRGAFTGEISTSMLLEAGCSWVIVGHSERRNLFGEDDELVRLKLIAALRAGLRAVLCVGELLEEREAGRTEEVVKGQVLRALEGLEEADPDRVVLAYEPVWAIGTGRNATPDEAARMHGLIRSWLSDMIGEMGAKDTRIIYGGSVNPENAPDLMTREGIDGALVGGASLGASSFLQIIRSCCHHHEH
ncbi:triose-phosphate isomerase [Candidatus Fermentibacterales bacterium]|nr:triose-phosphate isomerase [Candidatus Fermentibacterales bacterium]